MKSYWNTQGRSTCLHDSTKMGMGSFQIGVQRSFCFMQCLEFYGGLGVSYNLLRIHDHSEVVEERLNKNALGLAVQTGFYTNYQK